MKIFLFFYIFINICIAQLYESPKNSPSSILSVIKKEHIKNLCESVKSFDPYLSLNGGKCGLDAYKIIAKHSKKFLKSKGLVCLEIGFDQKKDVKRIFKMNDFRIIEEFKDLNKKDRVLIFENKI